MEVLKRNERKRGMMMDPDWTTKYRVIEVEENLVQLETMGSQSGCTYEEAVRLTPADSSRETEDTLQVTCTVPLSPVSSQPEPGCETAEDTLEDSDVVITGVQPGQPLPASLASRVAHFRAMVLQPDTWLDDCAIDHAQALPQAKYPHVGRLYATTSLALLSTMPAPAQRFVQILNVCSNRWVTGRLSVCSGRMYRCRKAAQIVGCLPSQTVSLSAETGDLTPFPSSVRFPPALPARTMEVDVHCHCKWTVRQAIIVSASHPRAVDWRQVQLGSSSWVLQLAVGSKTAKETAEIPAQLTNKTLFLIS
ncbi:hypothetical protein JZ751_005513, partial [Albula glossodonta]